MLHIVTIHHNDPRWINLQREQFDKTIKRPFKVWASLEGIPHEYQNYFDAVIPAVGSHEGKLNLLGSEIAESGKAEDLMMFIDGDALIIADPEPLLQSVEERYDLIAVQRRENLGDVQPHPLFAVMSVRTWRDLPGDWSPGHSWVNDAGERVTDVGGNLLKAITRRNAAWYPIMRSNRRNIHPVWFGLYGDVVYHHGAGFRAAVSRFDIDRLRVPPHWSRGHKVQRILYGRAKRVMKQRSTRLSEAMFGLLQSDFDQAMNFLRGESYLLTDSGFRKRLDAVFDKVPEGRKWDPLGLR